MAAQLVALTAGVVLLIALGGWRMPLGLFLPTAWISGTGLLAAEHLLLSQASVPWNPVSLGLPWLVVAGLAVWRVLIESKGRWNGSLQALRHALDLRGRGLWRSALPVDALAGVVIVAWTAKLLVDATTRPQLGWDALIDWLLKGRAIYMAGGLPLDFFKDPYIASFSHPDYPTFVPLTIAYIYAWTGENDILVKGWWALLAGAMAAGVYFGLQGLVGVRARLGGLVLLLGIPALTAHASGYFAGYAELPLAVLFFYGALFLYRWLKQPASVEFAMSAFFFSLAGFTKNEGLPVAAAGLALLFGMGMARKRLNWEGAMLAVGLATLVLVPWQIEKQLLGLTSDLNPTLGGMVSNWDARFGLIISSLVTNAREINNLNLTWILLPVLAVLALVFAPRRMIATLPIVALILAHLAATVAAYLTTPYDIHWHLGTSADRLVFQSTMLAVLLSIIYLGIIFDKREPHLEGT